MRTKWLEMQGKTVNGFKILEVYRENKRTMAKVVCPACGKTFITRAEHIKNGKNCGCTTRIKMNDLTGKKFGRLTAIEPTNRKASNGAIIWKCICDCGNVNFVDSGSLTKGRVQSCGCLRKPHEIEQGKRMAAETKKQCIDGTSIRSLTMKKPKTNTSGINGWHRYNLRVRIITWADTPIRKMQEKQERKLKKKCSENFWKSIKSM